MHPVFLLTLGFFLVGAPAIAWINRTRTEPERSEGWKKYWVYLVIVHLVIAAILAGPRYFAWVAAALVAGGLLELLTTAARIAVSRRWAVAVALGVYAAVGLGFIQFARQSLAEKTLFVYVVVLTFDGFSQVTGQLLGRRRLAPRVSPGKTMEGFAGGLAMAGLTALPLATWMGMERGGAVALALLLALFALGGDLAASYVKRLCGVKDYGRLLPGHGGILDRFDSFIAAGTVYWSALCR